jgi:hypothetical protein
MLLTGSVERSLDAARNPEEVMERDDKAAAAINAALASFGQS